jgi:dienelactone hydrolase
MVAAPYGSWASPITAELIVQAAVGLGGPAFGGGDLWWSELRPDEGGRVQIVRKALDAPAGAARDVLPEGFSARTRVHEYGGGAWWLHGETLFFANWSDQRLYRLDPGGKPVALTPEPESHHALRYADGCPTPDGRWLVCVREWHGAPGATEARNQLVAIPADHPGDAVVLVGDGDQGAPDFVSSPRISGDGTNLRWVQWNHPDMPWDRTVVGRGRLVERDGALTLEGARARDRRIVSTTQPRYGPEGTEPYSVADVTGWWRIWMDGMVPRPIVTDGAEWAEPQWVFGQSSYAFTDDGRGIVGVRRSDGRDHLVWIPATNAPDAHRGVSTWISAMETSAKRTATSWGEAVELDVPFTAIEGVTAGPGGTVAMVAATFTGEPEVVTVDTAAAASGSVGVTVHRPARALGFGAEWLSVPEHITFLTTEPEVAHGLYYAPANPDHEGPEGTLPPLVVLSHGGPTAAARPQLNLGIQYWTSRGFAVVDVNYRGSTGYGRRYREALNGQWGIVDVEDCRAAARGLAEVGLVDPDRLVIRGGSAGGYTTLRALTTGDDFAAGASLYGVADLEALARDTHKFESRYLDRLVGPYPEARDVYVERSPIHHVDRLATPLIILQGLEDEIVPPAQAKMMVEALQARKVPFAYLTFEGEQHGFRQAASIRRALEAELYFYGRVLGFEPADDLEPVPIEFL